MNEGRKRAYRSLLYYAMLEIRMLWWSDESHNAEKVLSQYHQSRSAGQLAYWLHNLAASSCDDFTRFDEQAFWDGYNWFKKDFPKHAFDYKQLFKDELKSWEEGNTHDASFD